jgi:hypothetical protein
MDSQPNKQTILVRGRGWDNGLARRRQPLTLIPNACPYCTVTVPRMFRARCGTQ